MISAEEFLVRHPVRQMPDDASHGAVSGVASRAASGRGATSKGRFGAHAEERDVPARRRAGAWSRSGGTASTVDDPKDIDACREAALRLLDAAPRSSGALRARLIDKGYDVAVVDEVIERLIVVNLLDDDDYAQCTVRYCVHRLMGARGALMELTRKGVDRQTAEHAVNEARDRGLFEEAAWELGRQYAGKTQGLDPNKRRQRFWSAGGRKGHDPETLRRVAQDLF